jgi:hypothetical protein
MMAMMEAAGKDVRYYENIEGGHGGAANNAQAAHMNALAYTFLWQQLTKDGAASDSGDAGGSKRERRPRGAISGSRL